MTKDPVPIFTCPECGAPMRPMRRGATLKKHGPAYVCTLAEAETIRDERGYIKRVEGAKHTYTRAWEVWELRPKLAELQAEQASDPDPASDEFPF